MEINSKKPGIARSNDENRALAKAMKAKDGLYSSTSTGIKQPELKEGQQVKGQILDLRYNEVRIRLEPDQQVITARLSGDVPLAIGDEARFIVTEENGQMLSLKYMPDNTASSTATINKALTASNLPQTDRNKTLVEQLLNHRMPIDKQTLLLLSRAAVLNKEASPLSLVLMYKNNIPLTSANIRQYDSYQNGTGQLLNDIRSITSNITDLLTSTEILSASGDQLTEALQINDKLLSMLTDTSNANATVTDTTDIYKTNVSAATEISKTNVTAATETLLDRSLVEASSKEAATVMGQTTNALNQTIEAVKQTTENITQINDAINQTSEVMEQITSVVNQSVGGIKQTTDALSLLSNIASELKQGLLTGDLSLENSIRNFIHSNPEAVELFNNPASYPPEDIAKLLNALPPELQKLAAQSLQPYMMNWQDNSPVMNNANIPLNTVLDESGQAWLAATINSMPDSALLSSKLLDGTATTQEVFSFLQEKLPKMDESLAKALLSSPDYTELIENAFHKKWTITPEKLAQKGSIAELYHKLEEDMEKLKVIESADGKVQESLHLREPVKNLQDNIHFMKNLNEMFSYIQLPVQLQNKAIHSELYVYTNKKHLQEKKNLSVLLNLTMPNLGPINIHVQMDHNLIHAKFYLEDIVAKDIIEDQLPSLAQALKEKGYHLTSDVLHGYHKPDFTKDFIDSASDEGTPVRYSFDIRT